MSLEASTPRKQEQQVTVVVFLTVVKVSVVLFDVVTFVGRVELMTGLLRTDRLTCGTAPLQVANTEGL